MIATVGNMRRFEDRRDVFAYDPTTGERFSATAGDYWQLADDEPLVSTETGETLVLCVEHVEIVEVEVAA